MDNQNSDKKRPFGRDDRGGRSFFRTRRDGTSNDQDNRGNTRTDERPRRPDFKKDFKPAFKKEGAAPKEYSHKEDKRPYGDDKRPYGNDNRNRGYGNREERGGTRDERPTRFGSRDDRPSKFGGRDERPTRFGSRDDRPSKFGGRDDRAGKFTKFDKPATGGRFGDRDARDGRDDRDGKRERRSKYKEAMAPVMPDEVRLNRFIAMSGVCSRREADQLIAAGEVTVNGVMTDQLGSKVRPATDEIRLNGELLKGEKKVYIVLNKPKGYVTTVEDPHADRTVIDLLKGECRERVYPVGRLDKNTTGVLLLTNDGNMTKELTHPSYAKKKIYHVFLDKPCSEEALAKLAQGIDLEDGPIKADAVSFVDDKGLEVGVELHSGRNRIVRRMFESLGYDVTKLDRVYFAGLTKMGLRRGFWRHLTPREVAQLKAGSYE